jgi:hypothetical protein
MAHVHLLGDVRRRVVDDGGEPTRLETQVDEARSSDARFAHGVRGEHGFRDGAGEVPRRFAELLGGAYAAVDLIVSSPSTRR